MCKAASQTALERNIFGTSKADASGPPPKLIAFIYNNTQSYVLEFGDRYVRFISNGAYLTNPDGGPYELATPYGIADAFWLRHAQSADVMTLTHASYPAMNLSRRGETDWTLEAISYSAGIDAPYWLSLSAIWGERCQYRHDARCLSGDI